MLEYKNKLLSWENDSKLFYEDENENEDKLYPQPPVAPNIYSYSLELDRIIRIDGTDISYDEMGLICRRHCTIDGSQDLVDMDRNRGDVVDVDERFDGDQDNMVDRSGESVANVDNRIVVDIDELAEPYEILVEIKRDNRTMKALNILINKEGEIISSFK